MLIRATEGFAPIIDDVGRDPYCPVTAIVDYHASDENGGSDFVVGDVGQGRPDRWGDINTKWS